MFKRNLAAMAAAVGLSVLFSGCTITAPVDNKVEEPSSSLPPIESSSSPQESITEDWSLSAVARNAAFKPYMTMEEYDVLFGTSGMLPSSPAASPDGQRLAYIYPNEFEEPSDLYLYDTVSKKADKLLLQQDLPQTDGLKQVSWVDDQSLLLIIGHRYGTVSPGGAVYLLNIKEAPKLRLLYKPEKETDQVLNAALSGNTLTMTVTMFDDNYLNHTEEQRTVTVDPANAPQPAQSSAPSATDVLATVIDNPTPEQVVEYKAAEAYEYDQSGESLLLIPKLEGTRVTIDTMGFDEKKSEFVPVKTVYDKTSARGYALWLKALRPEGGPQLCITLQVGGVTAHYYVTYNGKDGNVSEAEIYPDAQPSR